MVSWKNSLFGVFVAIIIIVQSCAPTQSVDGNDETSVIEFNNVPLEDSNQGREAYGLELVDRALFGETKDGIVIGEYAYFIAGATFIILDVSNYQDPVLVGYLDLPAKLLRMAVDSENSSAYIVNEGHYQDDFLYTVDFRDKENPILSNTLSLIHGYYGSQKDPIVIFQGYLYVLGEKGVAVFDLSDPFHPTLKHDIRNPFPDPFGKDEDYHLFNMNVISGRLWFGAFQEVGYNDFDYSVLGMETWDDGNFSFRYYFKTETFYQFEIIDNYLILLLASTLRVIESRELGWGETYFYQQPDYQDYEFIDSHEGELFVSNLTGIHRVHIDENGSLVPDETIGTTKAYCPVFRFHDSILTFPDLGLKFHDLEQNSTQDVGYYRTSTVERMTMGGSDGDTLLYQPGYDIYGFWNNSQTFSYDLQSRSVEDTGQSSYIIESEGDIILMNGGGNPLTLFDTSGGGMVESGNLTSEFHIGNIEMIGDYIYLESSDRHDQDFGNATFQIIDISDPDVPFIASTIDMGTDLWIESFLVIDQWLILTAKNIVNNSWTLMQFDISDPAHIQFIDQIPLLSAPQYYWGSGTQMAYYDGSITLFYSHKWVYSVPFVNGSLGIDPLHDHPLHDGTTTRRINFRGDYEFIRGIGSFNGTVFIPIDDVNSGISILEVGTGGANFGNGGPRLVGEYPLPQYASAWSCMVHGSKLYVGSLHGLFIFEIKRHTLPIATLPFDELLAEKGDLLVLGEGFDPDGGEVTYSWASEELCDEIECSLLYLSNPTPNPNHIIHWFEEGRIPEYYLILVVTDEMGGIDYDIGKLLFSSRPILYINADPSLVYKKFVVDGGEKITINCSGSRDSDGEIVGYSLQPWGEDPVWVNHSLFFLEFDKKGVYEYNISIIDNDGMITTETYTIEVTDDKRNTIIPGFSGSYSDLLFGFICLIIIIFVIFVGKSQHGSRQSSSDESKLWVPPEERNN